MFKVLRIHREEDGNGLMLCILVLFVLLGIGGLVIDLGIVYKTKGEMRKAANAAALSGVQAVFNDQTSYDTSVDGIVEKILKAHNKNYSNCAKPSYENNKVTVKLREEGVPLYFMKIFGKNSVDLEVTSNAIRDTENPVTEMTGVLPLGIEYGTKLNTGEEYTLKLDSNILGQGWFGFLDFSIIDSKYDGLNLAGESALEGLVKNGYGHQIVSGDTIEKIQGAKAAVDKVITNKVVPIIVYQFIIDPNTGEQSLKVAGFAYFEILNITTKKEIVGKFIRTVDTISSSGTVNDAIVNKIRLVE